MLMMPFGFVCIPAIAHSLNRLGYTGSLHLVNMLGMLCGILQLIPILPLQIATFVIFTIYRAFLYSVVSTCTAAFFGQASFGRAFGSIFFVAGIINFCQYPFMQLTNSYFGGSFFHVNLCLVMVCIPLVPVVCALRNFEGTWKQQSTTVGV